MGNIFMVLVTGVYAILMLLHYHDMKKRKAIRQGISMGQDIRQQAKAGNQIAKLISLIQWLLAVYVAIIIVLLVLTKMG